MEIVLIVAVAENGVIGRDNAIPWRLKSDQQRLKAITLNKPVVMGRKTYLSIGAPLRDRTNIVVSRDPTVAIETIGNCVHDPCGLAAPSVCWGWEPVLCVTSSELSPA